VERTARVATASPTVTALVQIVIRSAGSRAPHTRITAKASNTSEEIE
jgi:hypothetical protein